MPQNTPPSPTPQPTRRSRRARRLLTSAALVGAATALCATTASTSAHAVINGKNSTQAYPFMASIPMALETGEGEGKDVEGVCGAALVAPQWVVTAGHCAQQPGSVGAHPAGTVRIGSEHRTSGGTVRKIVKKVVHPGYDATSPVRSHHDIALLKLDRPVAQQPIRMADREARVGAPTRVLGFGTVVDELDFKDWVFPERLQELNTRRAPASACQDIDAATELCTASRVPDAMACKGDSGGPQIQRVHGRWQLVGTTSGDGDADPHCATGPGVYTSVPAHRAWLTKVLATHR
ncbi:S1 family peptidase [Streptomyces buecherae]|uniref:S1 family peptidase n=1 Tax=Streptomyces buecherae TaxID=2763006 RepID=UPI001C26546D|nr:serine protease [Streptomyces buecherae]